MARLSSTFIRQARAGKARPGRYSDGPLGHGLRVFVKATERRSAFWIQRLTIQGRSRDWSLGPLWSMSLAEARELALENHRIARAGGDPRTGAASTGGPDFRTGVEATIALLRPTWRDARAGQGSEAEWRGSLERHAPALMPMKLATITGADVLATVEPLWHERRATAKRVLQRIGRVCEWAVAHGHAAANPCSGIAASLPANGNGGRKHHEAIPHGDVQAALSRVDAVDGGGPGRPPFAS